MNQYLRNGEKFVEADNQYLQYSGRIDWRNKKAPEFVYPCTFVKMKFIGTGCKVVLSNKRSCWDNYIGYIIDGKQEKALLPAEGDVCLTLCENLECTEHEVMLFKRMDSCHIVTFHGFIVEESCVMEEVDPLPERRIEVYGDSVSAGEVSEAVEYVGQVDPEHNGEYSNSWYSYSWMTARKLNAQLHDIAQGGIALLDKTGWFASPNYVGMESSYYKIKYHPELGGEDVWDFSLYRPHVVIVAIGQNDSHPVDYMAADYNCECAKHWRKHYKMLVEKLRIIYPEAHIILQTTLLAHHENWDKSIEQVCLEMNDPKIHHYMYKRNGCGTLGHLRIPEAEEMAEELSAYIESLGEDIWKTC